MAVTHKDVVDAVRKLAKEKPKNVYKREEDQCCYNSGICSDGSVGCIFGQAIKGLGLTITHEGKAAPAMLELLGIGQDSVVGVCRWMRAVQRLQDDGKTWGEAVEIADKGYPLSAP